MQRYQRIVIMHCLPISKSYRTLLFSLILLLYLSGCSSVPIFSMVRLSQLDPFTMDPNQVEIAVITHKALQVKKGDVRMSLGYRAEDDSLVIQDVYLVEVKGPNYLDKDLANQLEEDQTLTIMHLSEADANQLRESQRLISQHQRSKEKGEGSFGVGVNGSCVHKSLPEDELLVSIFLKPDARSSFIKVVDKLDLYEQNGAKEIKNWPKC